MTLQRAVRWAAIVSASVQTLVAGWVISSIAIAGVSAGWDGVAVVLLFVAGGCALAASTFGPRLGPRIQTGVRIVASVLAVAQLAFGSWLLWRLIDKWANGERFPKNWIEASWLLIIGAFLLSPIFVLVATRQPPGSRSQP